MTSSGSPCGACKFLRRKCVKGCVFAPYFCHEQGATHFAAIHKVFGASNVSKLLSHLPVSDRCEAAVTISYEAQARLQDPIYGCVSHIFALQQQVVNLQSQLASLKELQATQCIINSSNSSNPSFDPKIYGATQRNTTSTQDVHSWWQSFQNQGTMPQFDANMNHQSYYHPNGNLNPNPCHVKYENPSFPEENTSSFGSMDSVEMQSNNSQWSSFQEDGDHDLQSLALRYINQHS
ncbi:hypothetical protein RD792_009479 [Penstemon davidsonii]|uniref:LOB domain-containing protein n=1 Tax=Penstemon davidsonii TaxID=160366 RepID=A0ABR0CZ51_9LAMI|nr:hypothetical protein RD792_009479 [Penstemon davidsonii]